MRRGCLILAEWVGREVVEMGARGYLWGLNGDAKVNVVLLKRLQVLGVAESRAARIVGSQTPRSRGGEVERSLL